MRVLFLTSTYPIPQDPGWGPFVQTVARGVALQGCSVRVLMFSPDHHEHRYDDGDGVEVYLYPYVRRQPVRLHLHQGLIPSVRHSWLARLQVPAYLRASRRGLERHLDEFSPDVVHAHWYLPAGWVASRVAEKRRCKLVTTAWGAEFHLPVRWPFTRLLRGVDARSARTAAVSQYMRTRARLYGLDTAKMAVVPNGVDTSRFHPGGGRAPGGDRFVIGTARRLVPEKRVEHLIEAVALLPGAVRSRVEVRIAGDGPDRQRLERLAEQRGLHGQVSFLGPVANRDMPEVLRGFDVFVNPSIQEGMATANLEAMACGVAILAYRGVGNEEVVVDGETGYLVPSQSIEALAERLAALAAEAEQGRQLGRRGRALVEEHFSQDAVGREYLEVYGK